MFSEELRLCLHNKRTQKGSMKACHTSHQAAAGKLELVAERERVFSPNGRLNLQRRSERESEISSWRERE